MTGTERVPARRPRNRKAQLADSAAELFRRHGYHQVGVADIAATAGVTGPALYRHFRSKQDILAHVLLSSMDAFGLVTEEALARPGTPEEQLTALLEAVAALAVDRREVTALWRWEGRHLDRADQTKIRHRSGELMARWGTVLRDVRPDLEPRDAELLCWAALSVFGSVSLHHVNLPRRRLEALLATLARAVLDWPVPDTAAAPEPARLASWQLPSVSPSRREELLTAATRLFRDRGYHAVSMEDIGAAAGIAGPSIYRYFPGKAAILVAAGYRMADRLARTAEAAVGDAVDPADALARLAESYVDTVLRSDNIMATFASELANLPDRDRKELVRVQRNYVARWTGLVRAVSPELSEADARTTVHAALTVVNDLARTPRIVARPRIAAELTSLAVTVLSARK
ncbi:TetR/AcrR family transcriptional regulator [Actinophytocola xanthii]|uniref:TetR family transcriptional regulator n=1 Tax=Actinophytocola xanthii TaxID=1912961 RepID=A0A1Q8CU78_9PSEU|nr:TetR/AcrR family transcriptional regulator [Actinophytocola xanthii]OLF17918.1 TetR family transcriptional regulator [Actinophytocola xanthii]